MSEPTALEMLIAKQREWREIKSSDDVWYRVCLINCAEELLPIIEKLRAEESERKRGRK